MDSRSGASCGAAKLRYGVIIRQADEAMNGAAGRIAALIFAAALAAQDLPPGVLLLARAKSHMREELQRITNVSCLETVERELQLPGGKIGPLDTIRLEVVTNGQKELYASPGGRNFSEQHPISYVASGTLGDGLFGPYLQTILLNGAASNRYVGDEDIGGRRLARYDYRLAPMWSGQTIHMPAGSGTVGLRGSYWIDPETLDVLRLELNADDIPPTLPLSELVTRIDYARTRLANDLGLLLPQAADFRFVKSSGEISHNRVEFTHCRVFQAESTIDYSEPGSPSRPPRFGASALDDTLRTLPGGMQVAVKLRGRITGDMAVGTLIDGDVAGDVAAKRATLIPSGSPVRGRIRRMERYTDPFPYFVVGLEFTKVEIQGIRHLFYADLVSIDPLPALEANRLVIRNTTTRSELPVRGRTAPSSVTVQTGESLSFTNMPGVVTFIFKGPKLELPEGFRTVWKTRALTP
jgi:hypothetical protein